MGRLGRCVVAVLVLLATYPPAVHAETLPAQNLMVTIGGLQGLIANPQTASLVLRQCSRATPDSSKVTGYWTPTNQHLQALEDALPDYVKQQHATLKDLASYRRVYVGMIYEGRRVVYVDFAYQNERKDDWAENLRTGCDGGNRYFGVEFDVDTREFSNLLMNGEA
jgi:hypothetical protein